MRSDLNMRGACRRCAARTCSSACWSSASASSATGCSEELEPLVEPRGLTPAPEAAAQEGAKGPRLRGRQQRLGPADGDEDPGVHRRPRSKRGSGNLTDEAQLPPRRPAEAEQRLRRVPASARPPTARSARRARATHAGRRAAAGGHGSSRGRGRSRQRGTAGGGQAAQTRLPPRPEQRTAARNVPSAASPARSRSRGRSHIRLAVRGPT